MENNNDMRKVFKIGDILNVKVDKLVFGGEGIAHAEGFIFFVPMSVPQDELEIEIISLKKTYGRGIIKKIITPSPDRIKDHDGKISFEDFNGCDFGMMSYENQLKYKDIILKEVLKKIGNIDIEKDNIEYEAIEESKNKTNYRNKTSEPFYKQESMIYTGFYNRKSHKVFSAEKNILCKEILQTTIDKFLEKINALSGTRKEFKVYNEELKTGFLKHIIVRCNEKDEVMIVIVVDKESRVNDLKNILKDLYKENEYIKSTYISINDEKNNVIMGKKTERAIGVNYIEEEINNIKFRIYPESFFQVNKLQAEKLFNKAVSYFGDIKNKIIIDAFSGTGTIGMILAKEAKEVICIESESRSVESGMKTASENKIKNVLFINNKVENAIAKVTKKKTIDGIIFDPPRKGIEEKVLKHVMDNKIKDIVYISCNPSTLARDLNILKDSYEISKIGAVDMFSQTHHIEVICKLTLKK